MEENKDDRIKTQDKMVNPWWKSWISDILAGMAIGVAFIIPGFSGGSVAAILGVYEKMVSAIANIFREMKKSILTLMPIGIGLVIGAVSLMFPLSLALSAFPLPTVSLFVGLAIGGVPSVTNKLEGRMDKKGSLAFVIPLLLALAMSFIPVGSDVDLFGLDIFGCLILFLIGMLGSCALVVPGISGSMMLLIIGYYNPLLNLIISHLFRFRDLKVCILVLGSFCIGLGVGFLLISYAMKYLLEHHRKNTYFAIVGFIVGSLPTVYISTMKSVGMLSASMEILSLPTSPWQYISSILLLALGIFAAYSFVRFAEGNAQRKKDI